MTKEQLIEAIGEIVHHFCRKPKANDSFWHIFKDDQKEGMYGFVGLAISAVENRLATRLIHNLWIGAKKQDGWKQGYPKDSQKKIHPLLVEWKELPPEQKMKLGILHDFTRRVLEYQKEKEKLESQIP